MFSQCICWWRSVVSIQEHPEWEITNGVVYFQKAKESAPCKEIPSLQLINQTLSYARELERIVWTNQASSFSPLLSAAFQHAKVDSYPSPSYDLYGIFPYDIVIFSDIESDFCRFILAFTFSWDDRHCICYLLSVCLQLHIVAYSKIEWLGSRYCLITAMVWDVD